MVVVVVEISGGGRWGGKKKIKNHCKSIRGEFLKIGCNFHN